MGDSSKVFVVGGLATLMVCGAFTMGVYVGRQQGPAASAPAAPLSAVSPQQASPALPQPPGSIAPVVVPAPGSAPVVRPAGTAARGDAEELVPREAAVEVPEGARRAAGVLRAGRGAKLLRAPEVAAEAIREVPEGASLEVRGLLGGFALVAWSAAGAAPVYGWTGAPEPRKTGTLSGHVRLSGAAPAEGPDPKRKEVEYCKGKDVVDSAVLVEEGMLREVLVRFGEVEGVFAVPEETAVIDQVDCAYVPRVLGVVRGQHVSIRNSDDTLHNVHASVGTETLFGRGQPRGAEPIEVAPSEHEMLRLQCDVHPWMRAHVIASHHPLFAVTGKDGAFRITGIPAGQHDVEAWHPVLGTKKGTARIAEDGEATLDFTFEAPQSSPPPPQRPRPRTQGRDARIGW